MFWNITDGMEKAVFFRAIGRFIQTPKKQPKPLILIGTHFDRNGDKENVFCRSLATIPTINAECHFIHGNKLKMFMQAISSIPNGEDSVSLQIGRYSIDEDATAWLNGNKLFQRHAVIVGSTGSGKSWCVAKILEQVALLKSADAKIGRAHV